MGELVVAEREEAPAHKPRIGRPQVYTSEMGQAICDKVRRGTPIEAACGVFGITRETFYDWKEQRDDFLYMFTCAYAEAEDYFTSILYNATKFPVGSVEYKAALEWLKRQRKTRWADTIDIHRIDVQVLQNILQGQQSAVAEDAQFMIEDAFDVL